MTPGGGRSIAPRYRPSSSRGKLARSWKIHVHRFCDAESLAWRRDTEASRGDLFWFRRSRWTAKGSPHPVGGPMKSDRHANLSYFSGHLINMGGPLLREPVPLALREPSNGTCYKAP